MFLTLYSSCYIGCVGDVYRFLYNIKYDTHVCSDMELWDGKCVLVLSSLITVQITSSIMTELGITCLTQFIEPIQCSVHKYWSCLTVKTSGLNSYRQTQDNNAWKTQDKVATSWIQYHYVTWQLPVIMINCLVYAIDRASILRYMKCLPAFWTTWYKRFKNTLAVFDFVCVCFLDSI